MYMKNICWAAQNVCQPAVVQRWTSGVAAHHDFNIERFYVYESR